MKDKENFMVSYFVNKWGEKEMKVFKVNDYESNEIMGWEMTEKEIESFTSKDWTDFCCGDIELGEDFMREFSDKIDWVEVSKYQVLSESFIREFCDKVYWLNISRFQTLSEGFIREFCDKVLWVDICCCQSLSEEFIREFIDKIDWPSICWNQALSEGFIREFCDKVYWPNISCFQTLSEELVLEFYNKIDWRLMKKNWGGKEISKKIFGKMNKEQQLYMIMNYREMFNNRVVK